MAKKKTTPQKRAGTSRTTTKATAKATADVRGHGDELHQRAAARIRR